MVLHIKTAWINWWYYRKSISRIIYGVPPQSRTDGQAIEETLGLETKFIRMTPDAVDNLLFSELNVSKLLVRTNTALVFSCTNWICYNCPTYFHVLGYKEIRGYETRQIKHLHLAICCTSLMDLSIKYQGSGIWNELLSNIDTDCCIGTFKICAQYYFTRYTDWIFYYWKFGTTWVLFSWLHLHFVPTC